MFLTESMLFSDNFILITSSYNLYKRKKILTKEILKIYKIDKLRVTVNVLKFVFSIIATTSLFFFFE